MVAFTRNMPQDATYWPPGSNDGTGGRTLGAAVTIKCRWQDTSVLFRDSNGQEVVSEAVVYVDRTLLLRGKLALGTHVGSPPTTAREIRQVNASSNLTNTSTLNKVIL